MADVEKTEAVESRKQIMSMMSQGQDDGGVVQMQALNDEGYDPNAEGRQAPEVKITRIYARLGSIVIVGIENDQQVEKQITIDEAMLRCRALLDMVKTPWKYKSDLEMTRKLLQSFVSAVETAKGQLSSAGFGKGLVIN